MTRAAVSIAASSTRTAGRGPTAWPGPLCARLKILSDILTWGLVRIHVQRAAPSQQDGPTQAQQTQLRPITAACTRCGRSIGRKSGSGWHSQLWEAQDIASEVFLMLLHIENGQGGSTGVRLDLRSLKKRFSGVQSEAIAAILEAMARVKETSSVQEFEEEGKNWVTEGEFVEATEHYKQAFSLGDEGYRDFLSTLKGELLKQGVHPIVIFTSEERKAIQSIFSTLDVDGSGHVSLQEFKRRLGTKGAETLQNFDDNKDGRMSIVEFVEGCKRIKKSGQEKLSLFFKTMQRRLSVASNKSLRVNVELNEEEKEILRVLFQQIDINKDQVLDLSELRKRLGTKAAFFLDKFDIDRDQTVRDWEWTRVFQTTKISDPGAFREHLERVKMVCASVANKTFKVPSSAQVSRDTGPSDSKASDSKAPDPQKVDGATVGV